MTGDELRQLSREALVCSMGTDDMELRDANRWQALIFALLAISEQLDDMQIVLGNTLPMAGRGA